MSSNSPEIQSASLPGATRFVIAEDDDDLRYIIVHILGQSFPFARISAFANGKEALDDFDAHGACLVISNHNMPIMDGPTFVRHLRRRTETLPILMVSGSPEAYGEGLDAGISFFLDKDELTARLTASVNNLLAGFEAQPLLTRRTAEADAEMPSRRDARTAASLE